MKHLLISCILLALCTLGKAQINLREGIVITLTGDTVRGQIDYRSDNFNAEKCVFLAEGETEPKTYLPFEIEGYRFLDNGRMYVSKNILTEDDHAKKVFLEWIVRGQLSLYYWGGYTLHKMYYLEDETGKMVKIADIPMRASRKTRHMNLDEALLMTHLSENTQRQLWEKALTRKNAQKAIREYNLEICPNGDCEVYEYKKRRIPKQDRMVHLLLQAGYTNYGANLAYTPYKGIYNLRQYMGYEYSPALHLSIGAIVYMSRISKGFYGEITIDYYRMLTQTKIMPDRHYSNKEHEYELFWSDYALRGGLGYQWKQLKIQPRLHGGVAQSMILGNFTPKSGKKDIYNSDGLHKGYYVGAGAVYPIGRHGITLDLEYHNSNYYKSRIKRTNITVGYQF